jgi:hypothetical protein
VPPDPTDGSDATGTRLSDADRDHVANALGRHYAEGRLDTAGLSDRLDLVFAAQSREEAAATLADLPPLGPATTRRSRRRHGEAERPHAGWIPTTERFRDPTTRRVMRVWIDPRDAGRHYVPEA